MDTNNMATASEWSAPRSSLLDINQHRHQSANKIGIYGWRKRCLYLFISVLMVMVIINMALTLWIVKVMDFSVDGMGKLRIMDDGLRLEGKAEFLHELYATNIKARKDHSMKIESSRNLTLNARNLNGEITNRLFLGDQKLEVLAAKFTVLNSAGKTVFSSTDNEVKVDAETLEVTGEGGAVFSGSVRTAEIQGHFKSNLKIESPTSSLNFDGPVGIAMESKVGDIQASSLMDLKLQSTNGAVIFDAKKIYFNKLPEMSTSPNANDQTKAYQLCVCENGHLFLALGTESCVAGSHVC